MSAPVRTKPPLRPKVIITGAGQRIGLDLVKYFIRQNYDVLASVRQSTQELTEFKKCYPERLFVVEKDLTTSSFDVAFWKNFQTEHGPLCAFIHSASTFIHDEGDTTTPEIYKTQATVNKDSFIEAATGYYQFVKKEETLAPSVAPSFIALIDQKVLRINPNHFSYTLSKLQLANSIPYLAQALAPIVRVNAVSPGLTLRSGAQTDEDFQNIQKTFPFGYGARTLDIAKTVEFLVSQRALVGQTITVDGGQHLLSDVDVIYKLGKN